MSCLRSTLTPTCCSPSIPVSWEASPRRALFWPERSPRKEMSVLLQPPGPGGEDSAWERSSENEVTQERISHPQGFRNSNMGLQRTCLRAHPQVSWGSTAFMTAQITLLSKKLVKFLLCQSSLMLPSLTWPRKFPTAGPQAIPSRLSPKPPFLHTHYFLWACPVPGTDAETEVLSKVTQLASLGGKPKPI